MIYVQNSKGEWVEIGTGSANGNTWTGTSAELEEALPGLEDGTAVFVTDD